MPICSRCKLNQPRKCFGKSQLRKKKDVRRCLSCASASPRGGREKEEEARLKSDKDACQALHSWLGESKGMVNHVQIRHYAAGHRGVVARRNVKQGENLLEIPLDRIITAELAKGSAYGVRLREAFSKAGRVLDNQSYIALFLLLEKRSPEVSEWTPYLNMLPSSYEHIPHMNLRAFLEPLRGTVSYHMLVARERSLRSKYELIGKLVPGFTSLFTPEEFLWAKTVVLSRVFAYRYRGGKMQALVPMADMLNHAPNCGTRWGFDEAKNHFFMRCTRKVYRAGLEVFDTYGSKCNHRFLINYGFALDDNTKYDEAHLFLPAVDRGLWPLTGEPQSYDNGYSGYASLVEEGGETLVSREKMFRFGFGRLCHTAKPYRPQDRTNAELACRAMFSYARVAVATPGEISAMVEARHQELKAGRSGDPRRRNSPLYPFQVMPRSVEHELRALSLLRRTAADRLSKGPLACRSLAEDLRVRSTLPPFSRERNILNVIISEKELLVWLRDLCGFVLERMLPASGAPLSMGRMGNALRQYEDAGGEKCYHSYAQLYWRKIPRG